MHIDTSPVIRASIWIPLNGEAHDAVVKSMRLARQRAGGPEFHPHVTLLRGIERTRDSAIVKLKELAQALKPFTVRLGRIAWRTDYYRCLFATVAMSTALAAAHRRAHEIFEMDPPEPFEPHVSLLYGSLDESAQQALARELGGSLHVSFEARALQLVNAAMRAPVAEWKTLAERPLGP